jgi:hypothetical protein
MALGERLPEEYDGPKIEGIIETLERKVKGVERVNKQELTDLSKDLKDQITLVEQTLTDKIESGLKEDDEFPTTLPVPQNLKVFEAIVFGFAHVDPFQRVKYFGKLVNYEFYGSQNSFDNTNQPITPQEQPYEQVGTHRGTGTVGSPDTYLNTEHPTDSTYSFVLDDRLFNPLWVGALKEKRLVLENLTRRAKGKCDDTEASKLKDADGDFVNKNIVAGMYAHNMKDNKDANWTEILSVAAGELSLADDIFADGDSYEVGTGRISGFKLGNAKYQIQAEGVSWVAGDQWRIKVYPQNKLFSIGAFCTFTKRVGSYYVLARSVGKGNSFSPFTDEVESTGISSGGNLPIPTIVYPVHNGAGDGGGITCTLTGGLPDCPNHGVVPWSEIISGSREVAHFDVFGFERSVMEIVYEDLELDDPVLYKVLRTTADGTEGDVS